MAVKPKHQRILDVLKKLWALQHRSEHFMDTHVTPEGWVYRADVQCHVKVLEYDFAKRRGTLKMEDGSCTDMMGCVRLFQAIDPNVSDILTFSGERRDTRYMRSGEDWRAFGPVDKIQPSPATPR